MAFSDSVPPGPGLQWQFNQGRLLPGHRSFESVLVHETIHLLGSTSAANAPIQPNGLFTVDLVRVAEAAVPIAVDSFGMLPRELRPTAATSYITRLGTAAGAYKASRGERPGGDNFGASHWRAYTLLDPDVPIGVMDPLVLSTLTDFIFAKADVEALDIIGWNVEPDDFLYQSAIEVTLVNPGPDATVPFGTSLTFEWETAPVLFWCLFIYQGTEVIDDLPYRTFDDLATTSVTLSGDQALPIGEYVWYVVGSLDLGYKSSPNTRLTVVASCSADINCDGNVDQDDVGCIINVVAGNLGCECADPDFNQDGNVDQDDAIAIINVVAGGPCP